MKKLFMTIAFALLFGGASAQNVRQEGKVFIQQKKERTQEQPTKTEFSYKASDGIIYPIYLSKRGKAFIIRTSKRSGKEYKQYLPEVTEELEKQKNDNQ